MHSLAYELARCPVCNGADSREVAGTDEVRDEMEALWGFHTRRLRADTPPERLTDRIAFSQMPPLRLVQCERCDTVFRNPRERAFEVIENYADDPPRDQPRAFLDALCVALGTERSPRVIANRRPL